MKKSILLVAVAVTALTACAGGVPSGSPNGSATSPPAVSRSSSPASTPTRMPATATNASCHEVAFHLDPALASGFTCETIPADNDPAVVRPALTRVTLSGYSSAGGYESPVIEVMPIATYTAMEPSRVPGFVAELSGYASGESTPAYDPHEPFPLPVLPMGVRGASLISQYATMSFVDGSGVRFVTQFGTEVAPFNNAELVYVFEGVSADGAYWVTVTLPLQNPILPANGSDPPSGQTWDQFDAGYATYALSTAGMLDAQPQDSFSPSIALLDALAASIVLTP